MTSGNEGNSFLPAWYLTGAIAIGWVAAFWPARMLNGESGVFWMTIAAVTCLVPGWIVLGLSSLSIFPNEFSVMVVQSMIRLSSVASVAVVVRRGRPELGFADFFGWLTGFYSLALLVEVLLFRRSDSRGAGKGRN